MPYQPGQEGSETSIKSYRVVQMGNEPLVHQEIALSKHLVFDFEGCTAENLPLTAPVA